MPAWRGREGLEPGGTKAALCRRKRLCLAATALRICRVRGRGRVSLCSPEHCSLGKIREKMEGTVPETGIAPLPHVLRGLVLLGRDQGGSLLIRCWLGGRVHLCSATDLQGNLGQVPWVMLVLWDPCKVLRLPRPPAQVPAGPHSRYGHRATLVCPSRRPLPPTAS